MEFATPGGGGGPSRLVAVVLVGLLCLSGCGSGISTTVTATVTATVSATPTTTSPPETASASITTAPSAEAASVMPCQGGGFRQVSVEADADVLLVRVELTEPIVDSQLLEILISADGDQTYETVVTYDPEPNSTHLWDGEDEFNFLVLRSSVDDEGYLVEIPLSELAATAPVRLLVNRWRDTGDGSTETCREQPLVIDA